MCDSEENCLLLIDDKLLDCEVGNNNFVPIRYHVRTDDSEMHNPAKTSANSFVCSICHRTFNKKANFERHHFTVHCKEKPYKCLVCNKSFKEKQTLKRHYSVHTSEKKKEHACGICHKTFKLKRALRIHFLMHEKPFTCNVCNKSFSFSSSLNGHFKLHHADNENLLGKNSLRERTHLTPNQLEKIVQFMEKHPDLNSGSICPDEKEDLWLELKESLNEDNSGSKKTLSQWKKCWTDKKLLVRFKVKQKKILSAIEMRMVPFIGYKVIECKIPSSKETKESNPSDVLITGLSVDYENSPKLNEQLRNCKENSDLSTKKQNIRNEENSFSDAYAYCSVSYGNQSPENQNLENENSFADANSSSSYINQSTEKQNLENGENYFTNAHCSSSCKNHTKGKISALKRIAVAAEKQALAAEKQALAMEKEQAALNILATQSVQQNETLMEILAIMKNIA